MLRWYRHFLEWYGQQNEDDQYVDDWLQVSTWRVYALGVLVGYLPVALLIRLFGL